jgi:hypothetical protein
VSTGRMGGADVIYAGEHGLCALEVYFVRGWVGRLRGELLCSDATVCWQSNPWKKSTAKMRWKWKKKRQRRLQRKRRKMRARSK